MMQVVVSKTFRIQSSDIGEVSLVEVVFYKVFHPCELRTQSI